MKFSIIGRPDVVVEGQFMNPEQYMQKPGSTVFYAFTGKLLFMLAEGGTRWCAIQPSYSTTYQLLEATEQEEVQLWAAGYRMMGLDRPGAHRCRNCNKAMQEGESFFGPKMWHCNRPRCGHGEFIHCPSCGNSPDVPDVCPECGCGELYC